MATFRVIIFLKNFNLFDSLQSAKNSLSITSVLDISHIFGKCSCFYSGGQKAGPSARRLERNF